MNSRKSEQLLHLYLLGGEYFSAASLGSLTGLVVSWGISPSWNMFFGMGLGVAISIILQVLTLVVLMPLFGELEIIIPCMISAMVSGMLLGMLATLFTPNSWLFLTLGGAIGIGMNRWIRQQSLKYSGDQQ